jgi:hypothetical protein
MKALLALVVLVVVSGISTHVLAETPSVGYEVAPCSSLDDPVNHNLMLTWIRGFVSGHDFTVDPKRNGVRSVDEATIVRSVDKFCRAHPDQNMLHAAMNLVDELHKSDDALAKAMKKDPMKSTDYQKLPSVCQKIIVAEFTCSQSNLAVDKLANPSFVTFDQRDMDMVKRQLYAAMPNIARTRGTAELMRECKTSYAAFVHGMEVRDVRNIVAHKGNASACKVAARAAIGASH